MTTQPDWLTRKSCRPEHAALFWPEGSGSVGPDFTAALAICRRCEVVAECKADAEAHGDIAGGYTTHGQVVGGCAPYKASRGERVPTMLQCCGEGCVAWFAKRSGANMYCSTACAVAARRASQVRSSRTYRERRAVS